MKHTPAVCAVKKYEETYGRWVRLQKIKPEVLLSGHIHHAYVTHPGEERNAYGMIFPTVVGSVLRTNDAYFAGCGIIWEKEELSIAFSVRQ